MAFQAALMIAINGKRGTGGQGLSPARGRRRNACSGKNRAMGSLKRVFLFLEPVFTICIGRFDDIKTWIQGKKRSKVGHLASIFNAVATFLGH